MITHNNTVVNKDTGCNTSSPRRASSPLSAALHQSGIGQARAAMVATMWQLSNWGESAEAKRAADQIPYNNKAIRKCVRDDVMTNLQKMATT